MAAVLCKGIGDICKGLGEVVCLPFKCLNFSCKNCCDVLATPFFCYIAVTYICNIPIVVFGLRSVLSKWCSSYTVWLLVNMIGGIAHLVGSVYIAYKISEDQTGDGDEETPVTPVTAVPATDEGDTKGSGKKTASATATPVGSGGNGGTNAQQQGGSGSNFGNFFTLRENEHGPANSSTRVKHILCFDPTTALYMIVFIAWFVWLCIGIGRLIDSTDDSKECAADQTSLLRSSLIFGFIYLCLFWCTFCCSLCCMK